MDWLFAVLIIAAVIYIGLILVEQTNYSMQIMPRIHKLNERAEVLVETCDREEDAANEVRDRATAAKLAAAEAADRVDALRIEIHREKIRKQRLEMEYFKSRVRDRRPVMA